MNKPTTSILDPTVYYRPQASLPIKTAHVPREQVAEFRRRVEEAGGSVELVMPREAEEGAGG